MKKCFNCNNNLPLWLYTPNPRVYQNVNNKGRNYVCKICNYKNWSKYMSAWIWSEEAQKFNLVKFNSKLDILKRLILNQ